MSAPPTIRTALQAARTSLSTLESGDLDAELLLAHALGKTRTYLYTWPEQPVCESRMEALDALLSARLDSVPVAYLTGAREFWDLRLAVTRDVLVPRPETELLIELVLALPLQNEPARILDAGTGSGAIALALAQERPHWSVVAIDRSPEALRVAQGNAETLGLELEFCESDWFNTVEGRFDVIVSNPPYVCTDDPALPGELRHEPIAALDGGHDGLNAIRTLVAEAPLNDNGHLLVEHGSLQGAEVQALMTAAGFVNVETNLDLAGLPRVTSGRRSTEHAG